MASTKISALTALTGATVANNDDLPIVDTSAGTAGSKRIAASELRDGYLKTGLRNISASVAPTTTDDSAAGYQVGSVWVDTTANKAYVCVDATASAAIWTETTQGSGSSSPLTTKGDLWGYTTVDARVAVGSNGQTLVADSAAGSGVSWARKSVYAQTAAPTTTDDTGSGYEPGSMWVDTTNDRAYVCVDATTSAAVWVEVTQGGGGGGGTARTKLTAATTLYVDGTLGSDSNDGTSSGSGAFATIQKAMDVVANDYDLGNYDLTVDVANGTYTSRVDLKEYVAGYGKLIFLGDQTTPSNVVIDSGADHAWYNSFQPGLFYIRGFKCTPDSSKGSVYAAGNGCTLVIEDIVCDHSGTTGGWAVLADMQAQVRIQGDIEIAGTLSFGIGARYNGLVVISQAITATLTSTPTFTNGGYAGFGGVLQGCTNITTSGTGTGRDSLAFNGGHIENASAFAAWGNTAAVPTADADSNYIPTTT